MTWFSQSYNVDSRSFLKITWAISGEPQSNFTRLSGWVFAVYVPARPAYKSGNKTTWHLDFGGFLAYTVSWWRQYSIKPTVVTIKVRSLAASFAASIGQQMLLWWIKLKLKLKLKKQNWLVVLHRPTQIFGPTQINFIILFVLKLKILENCSWNHKQIK